jgi:hypothetical protein
VRHSTSQAIKTWYARHQRFLTLSGAVIVFTTFVVKEGFREHLRDLVSSIEAAETNYAIGRGTSRTLREIGMVENMVAHLNTSHTTPVGKAADRLKQQVDAEFGELIGTQALLDVNRTLISALPGQHGYLEDKLSKLDSDLTTLWGPVRSQLVSPWRPLPIDFDSLHDRNTSLYYDVAAFSEEILREANAERSVRERYYSVCSVISYGLYTIGWAMTVVGRFSAGEQLGSPD